MIRPASLNKLRPPLKWFAAHANRLFKSARGQNASMRHPDVSIPDLLASGPLPSNLLVTDVRAPDLQPASSCVAEPQIHPFDLQYGTDTGGFIDGAELVTGHPHDQYNTAYYAMSPRRFERATDCWLRGAVPRPIEEYAFIDLGSGKGRALLLASLLPFREIIGVELHRELAWIAEANVRRWQGERRALCPISLFCQDATEFRFPEGPCLLYLFHPFRGPVLERLLSGLTEQFENRPNALDLLYFNPEGAELIERHPGFRHLWTEVLPVPGEEAATDTFANEGDLCSAYRWIGLG